MKRLDWNCELFFIIAKLKSVVFRSFTKNLFFWDWREDTSSLRDVLLFIFQKRVFPFSLSFYFLFYLSFFRFLFSPYQKISRSFIFLFNQCCVVLVCSKWRCWWQKKFDFTSWLLFFRFQFQNWKVFRSLKILVIIK